MCFWQQHPIRGSRHPVKAAAGARRIRKSKKRTIKKKIVRVRRALTICRAWLSRRCAHDNWQDGKYIRMESVGSGRTAAVSGVWPNGDGTVALPPPYDRSPATVCPVFRRGGQAAVVARTRVL